MNPEERYGRRREKRKSESGKRKPGCGLTANERGLAEFPGRRPGLTSACTVGAGSSIKVEQMPPTVAAHLGRRSA